MVRKLMVNNTLLVIMLVYAVLFLFSKHPSDPYDRLIMSDGKGYYAYLPAIFIYQDLDYGFVEYYESKYYPSDETPSYFKEFRYQFNGAIVNKYFAGIAILMLPFFLLAHLLALVFGQADGYSMAYQIAIGLSSFFYLLLGLLALRKLLGYFTQNNESQIACILMAVALGTNLAYYVVAEGTMPHAYLFFLVTSFLLLVYRAIHEGEKKYFLGSAAILGLILITRPQNGFVVLLVPFLAGNLKTLRKAVAGYFSDFRLPLQTMLVFVSITSIQMVLWYIQTGHLLVYTYGNETFDLLRPKIIDFLWSYEKGWMIYTPLSFLAIAGLIAVWRQNRWRAIWTVVFFSILTYVLSSWWVWHYTSQFGQRVFIDFYAMLALMLLSGFGLIRKQWWRKAYGMGIVVLIALNMFQYAQHLRGAYPAGPVNCENYWKSFFHITPSSQTYIPENIILKINKTDQANAEIQDSFPAQAFLSFPEEIQVEDSRPIKIFTCEYGHFAGQDKALIRTNLQIVAQSRAEEVSMLFEFFSNGTKYSDFSFSISRFLKLHRKVTTSPVQYLPLSFQPSDSVRISVSSKGNARLKVQSINVEVIKIKPDASPPWIPNALNSLLNSIIHCTNIDDSNPDFIVHAKSNQQAYDSAFAAVLNKDFVYNVEFNAALMKLFTTDNCVLKLNVRAFPVISNPEVVFAVSLHHGSKMYFYDAQKLGNIVAGQWNEVSLLQRLPAFETGEDTLKCYFWNTNPMTTCYIDDICLEFISLTDRHLGNPDRHRSDDNEGVPLFAFPDEVLLNKDRQFFGPPWFVLNNLNTCLPAYLYIHAEVKTNAWFPFSNFVVAHYSNDSLITYQTHYLAAFTRPDKWINLQLPYELPGCLKATDVLRVYAWNPGTKEDLRIKHYEIRISQKQ